MQSLLMYSIYIFVHFDLCILLVAISYAEPCLFCSTLVLCFSNINHLLFKKEKRDYIETGIGVLIQHVTVTVRVFIWVLSQIATIAGK